MTLDKVVGMFAGQDPEKHFVEVKLSELREWHEGMERLRAAIAPFAEIARELQPTLKDDHKNVQHWAVPTVGDFRRVLTALKVD
jgi:hypothetical protein